MDKEDLQKAEKRIRNDLWKHTTIATIFSTLMIVCAGFLSLGTINAELAMLIIVLLAITGYRWLLHYNLQTRRTDQLLSRM